MNYSWNEIKDQWLKKNRGIGFKDIVVTIENGGLLDIVPHHNPTKYPKQQIAIILIENYIWMVPFVLESPTTLFLKTAFPHKKATTKYLNKNNETK